MFGRLVLAGAGGRLGEVRTYQVCHGLMALAFLVWLFAGGSVVALLTYSILMGMGYGGFVSLAPAVLASEFGPERLGGLKQHLGSMPESRLARFAALRAWKDQFR